jgi:hypothetical protein
MFPVICFSQKRGNIWMLGANYVDTLGQGLDYNSGTVDTFSVFRPMRFFFTNAGICDTAGKLLFYTNGIYIENRNHDSLFNCYKFNPGDETNDHPYGSSGNQSALILPYPGSENSHFIIFHESAEYFVFQSQNDAQPLELRYSIVDMSLDTGLGGISEKKVVVLQDTLVWGFLTACKHANGRDWWVIAHRYYSNRYYKLLVTPDGIGGPFIQDIGSVITNDYHGAANFSPQGNYYAITSYNNKTDVMNFDRCTGEFSNCITLINQDSVYDYATFSNAFSPNERFLYVDNNLHIFQYDLLASNIHNSESIVSTWDTSFAYGFPTDYAFFQLAPDGKIYLTADGPPNILHIIDQPDSSYLFCNFISQGLTLTYPNIYIEPNLPNYDLGVLPGSPCDTIVNIPTGLHPSNSSSFRISPNPATIWLNIVYETSADRLFELFDINGKRVAATSLYHYFKNRLIDVSQFPAGIYLATVTESGRQIWSEKVVVHH